MKAFTLAILLSFLLIILAVPTASAVEKTKDYDFTLLPGTNEVIPFQEEWGGKIAFALDSNKPTNIYIIKGLNYTEDAEVIMGADSVTEVAFFFEPDEGNYSIVFDNSGGRSNHSAIGNETIDIDLTVSWNEDVPADPLLTAFCCGSVIIFIAILGYMFVRFFVRKPPQVDFDDEEDEEYDDEDDEIPPPKKTPVKKRTKTVAKKMKKTGDGKGQKE